MSHMSRSSDCQLYITFLESPGRLIDNFSKKKKALHTKDDLEELWTEILGVSTLYISTVSELRLVLLGLGSYSCTFHSP